MNQAQTRARTHTRTGTHADSDGLRQRLLHLEVITTAMTRALIKTHLPFGSAVERGREQGEAGHRLPRRQRGARRPHGHPLAQTPRLNAGARDCGPELRHLSLANLKHISLRGPFLAAC